MEIQLMLMFSKQVKQALLTKETLIEIDKETTLFPNQEALRKSTYFSETIESFLAKKKNYIEKISNEKQKYGKITIGYIDEQQEYYLSPIYREDLEVFRMKELDPLQFIEQVSVKTCSILKEKTGSEFAFFFQKFAFIFGTEYHIHQGYYRLIRDISARSSAYANSSANKLLRMFRETFSIKDGQDISLRYFWARQIYEYEKKQGYLKPSKPKKVTLYQVPQEEMVVEKKEVSGSIKPLEAFLDIYIEKHRGERIRLDEVVEEYKELSKNKVMYYREQ